MCIALYTCMNALCEYKYECVYAYILMCMCTYIGVCVCSSQGWLSRVLPNLKLVSVVWCFLPFLSTLFS